MPPKKAVMTEIVRKCLEIDVMAVKVYRKFMQLPVPPPVRALFRTLHDDETRHVAYWRGLLARTRQGQVGELFEEPEQILFELGAVADTALEFQVVTLHQPPRDVNSLLLATINMEYVLLHPSFLALFDVADILPGRRTMEDEYADHIDHLCGALNAQGAENRMFPLFGELLRRVWRETKRLVTQNQSDSLSGVLNRRGFHAQVRPLLYLARRLRSPIAVMVIDVDRFKQVNDRYGHQAGDKVLRLVAEAIVRSVRRSDLVSRYGGDEYLVFFLDALPDALSAMARKIKVRMREKTKKVAPVTVSVGIACLEPGDDPERELESLIRTADEALFEVKRSGRDGFKLKALC